MSEVYLIEVDTGSDLALRRFLIIKKKKSGCPGNVMYSLFVTSKDKFTCSVCMVLCLY
jgi:hypothetical protein